MGGGAAPAGESTISKSNAAQTELIFNCFEVPEERDDAFFALWSEVNQYMREKQGYLGHRLHRANTPGARYRFVNTADWESSEQFHAAHDEEFRKLVGKDEWREFPSTPQLFEIVHKNRK